MSFLWKWTLWKRSSFNRAYMRILNISRSSRLTVWPSMCGQTPQARQIILALDRLGKVFVHRVRFVSPFGNCLVDILLRTEELNDSRSADSTLSAISSCVASAYPFLRTKS